MRVIHCETGAFQANPAPALTGGSYETRASYERRTLGSPTGSTAGWISYPAISPIPSPPPVRLRAEPLSHRLPLQGGVILSASSMQASRITPPLRGSRRSRAEWRRLMRWGVRLDSGPSDRVAQSGCNRSTSMKSGNGTRTLLRPSPCRSGRQGGRAAHRRETERHRTGVHAGGTPALPGGPAPITLAPRGGACRLAGSQPCPCGRAVTLGGPSGPSCHFVDHSLLVCFSQVESGRPRASGKGKRLMN